MNETWLTVEQVAEFEGISRMEVYRRMKPGDAHFLISKEREEGKPGRLINARSMTFDAQKIWRKSLLETADKRKPEPSASQLGLLPRAEVDDQIDALKLSQSEREVAIRRYRIVDLCINCNWRAQGYSTKEDFLKALAERNRTSIRSIQRWTLIYRQSGKIEDLADEIPGPLRGTGAILNADMRSHLQGCYRLDKLKPVQCYRSLINYLEGKQNSPGCRVHLLYPIPSRTTVERFLCSLDAIDKAARKGADALKAACGHIDRTYRGLPSLGRVDTDEWITDVLAFDPRKASRVGRYYLLIFLDERSRYPLVWLLVEHPNEEDEINLLCQLIREFGVPGLINSDRGRFRGRTFGGRFMDRERAEMYRSATAFLTAWKSAATFPANTTRAARALSASMGSWRTGRAPCPAGVAAIPKSAA